MQKIKKKTIPKNLKIIIWTKYINEDIDNAKLLYYYNIDISQTKFYNRHIIVESNSRDILYFNCKTLKNYKFIIVLMICILFVNFMVNLLELINVILIL